MKVLLLNLYYPPDTSATAGVVEDVVSALAVGHQVTVVAGRPSYAPLERHPYYLRRRERDGHVTVDRVGSTAFGRGNKLGRVSNYVSYLLLTFIAALLARPRPDAVIVMTDPPLVSLVGAVVAKLRGCPLVYNIRDLHPDMAVASGAIGAGPIAPVWERLHRWSLRRADLVIVLGDDMRARILAKGIDPGRVQVVRDGARAPDPGANGNGPSALAEIRDGFEFVVLHAGNLGFAGVWDTLLEAARRVEGNGIGFVFVGDGALRASLEERAAGIGNVRFLPFYPGEQLPQVLASADLHVVTVRKGLEGLVVPSKLYPILMAGRPVLALSAAEADVARIVNEHGCGFVVDPDDPDAVAETVRSVRQRPEVLETMAQKARQASRLFDREHELKRFVGLVEAVAGAASTVSSPSGGS